MDMKDQQYDLIIPKKWENNVPHTMPRLVLHQQYLQVDDEITDSNQLFLQLVIHFITENVSQYQNNMCPETYHLWVIKGPKKTQKLLKFDAINRLSISGHHKDPTLQYFGPLQQGITMTIEGR